MRLVALERGRRGLLQVMISKLEDTKLQRYIKFSIELLQVKKGVYILNFFINLV